MSPSLTQQVAGPPATQLSSLTVWFHLQAGLIWLCPGLTLLPGYWAFHKLKICGKHVSSKSTGTIFPVALFFH